MTGTRKGVAVLCVALMIFGAFFAVSPAALADFVLVPLWIVLPAVTVTSIRRQALRCDEQPIALLAILDSRGPPSTSLL